MPYWDDPRGPRRTRDWPQDERRGERRAFGEALGAEPWRGREREHEDLYGDAGSAGYRATTDRRDDGRHGDTRGGYGGEPHAYAGQEYGLEGHSGPSGRYAANPNPPTHPHPDHAFDADYLRWRDEQLRAHDRDYQDWRREQHRQYDEQYRQFRSDRQRHFGEAFHMWRSQRGMAGGLPDTAIGSVGQGQGGYGDKTGIPGGYNAASAYDRPSGYLDPPSHLSADPAMSQVGGSYTPHAAAAPAGDRTPEFGREPTQVQSAADGETQGHEARRREEENDAKRGDAQRH